jgi:sulfur carrier protein
MRITLNGEPADTTAPTVAALVGSLPIGRAVAVNGEVVPRAEHPQRRLVDGDAVEVVEAVAGG